MQLKSQDFSVQAPEDQEPLFSSSWNIPFGALLSYWEEAQQIPMGEGHVRELQ